MRPPGLTYLHVVKDEEERFYAESLEELDGVGVWGRTLVVVMWRRTRVPR